jgi:hypothetical protein
VPLCSSRFSQDVDARVAAADVPIRELQTTIEKHRQDHGDEIQLAEARLGALQQQAATLSSATQAVKKCVPRWLAARLSRY